MDDGEVKNQHRGHLVVPRLDHHVMWVHQCIISTKPIDKRFLMACGCGLPVCSSNSRQIPGEELVEYTYLDLKSTSGRGAAKNCLSIQPFSFRAGIIFIQSIILAGQMPSKQTKTWSTWVSFHRAWEIYVSCPQAKDGYFIANGRRMIGIPLRHSTARGTIASNYLASQR